MSQLILETDNEQTLKLIQQLAEKLNIQSKIIAPKAQSELREPQATNMAIAFVSAYSQESTSFGDALAWQKTTRQDFDCAYRKPE